MINLNCFTFCGELNWISDDFLSEVADFTVGLFKFCVDVKRDSLKFCWERTNLIAAKISVHQELSVLISNTHNKFLQLIFPYILFISSSITSVSVIIFHTSFFLHRKSEYKKTEAQKTQEKLINKLSKTYFLIFYTWNMWVLCWSQIYHNIQHLTKCLDSGIAVSIFDNLLLFFVFCVFLQNYQEVQSVFEYLHGMSNKHLFAMSHSFF